MLVDLKLLWRLWAQTAAAALAVGCCGVGSTAGSGLGSLGCATEEIFFSEVLQYVKLEKKRKKKILMNLFGYTGKGKKNIFLAFQ